jgi:hypothetical protein
MSSSIFNSDGGDGAPWRRWIIGFVAATAILFLTLLAVIVLIDPFSTGHLTPITRITFVGDKHFSDVARVRDLDFEGAIFGNSHALRVDPENLRRLTGRRFVSLALEATTPREHMFMMRMFNRDRRTGTFVLVLGLDDLICVPERAPRQPGRWIPEWLYEGSDITYVSHILSPYALRMAVQRLGVLAGWSADGPPDGYVFERAIRLNAAAAAQAFAKPQVAAGPPPDAPFPYLDDLAQTFKLINADDIVLLVFMPVYWNQLPVAGSEADGRMAACKARTEAIARTLPRGAVVDLRVDSPMMHDSAKFFDPTHYKDDITRRIEAEIADRINLSSKGSSS